MPANRLKRIYEKLAGFPAQTLYLRDITYNAQGQIRAISCANDTSTAYTYGQDLRLSRILTSTLTDNLKSNIRSYLYDDLDRLKEAQNAPNPEGGYTSFTYQYDSIGNMIYKSDTGVMTYGENTPEVGEALLGGGNGLILSIRRQRQYGARQKQDDGI